MTPNRLSFPLVMVTLLAISVGTAADVRAVAPPDDELHLSAELALWGTFVDGTVGVKGVETDVNVDFADILDSLNLGAMGGATLTKGNCVFLFHGMYSTLENEVTFKDGRGGVVTSDMGIADFALGYTIVRTEIGDHMPFTITPVIGIRYTYLKMSLNPNQFATEDDHRDWLDPYVGGQVVLALSRTLDWRTEASIGGFGVGSDVTWTAGMFLDWHFSDKFALDVGYRAVSWDYDNEDFKWDVTFHGPWIGLTVKLF